MIFKKLQKNKKVSLWIIGLLTIASVSNAQVAATQTLSFTGSVQTFTLPNLCSNQVTITCYGAGGETGSVGGDGTSPGGSGAPGNMVSGTYTFAANSVLNVYVGGLASGTTGGFNGGGNGGATNGGGGGGATDIRIGGTALGNRIIVAGGGGGGGTGGRHVNAPGGITNIPGGDGGSVNGNPGTNSGGGNGGFGATGTSGGAFGDGCSGFNAQSGNNSTLGNGGNGGSGAVCCGSVYGGGGGGGGGYNGGGGGGGCGVGTPGCSYDDNGGGGGGAGGTNFLSSAFTSTVASTGINNGNGYVVISYYPGPGITISGATVLCPGTSTTLTASGASTYTWSAGPATAAYAVSPTVTTTYSVVGTNSVGCISNTVVQTVTVSTTCTPAAALNFDGSNDYVDIGTAITTTTGFTKEAWIYATASSSNNIISSGSSPFWLSGNHLSGYLNSTILQDPSTFALNVWTHVAVTYDAASTTLTLYKNGVKVAQNTSISGYVVEDIQIGGYVGGNNFQGSIDEARVWNVARSQCDINTYMNCEIPTTASGLVGNYHFNQGYANYSNSSVTILTDASAGAHNGTLTNFALTGTTSNWVAPGAVTTGSTTPLPAPTVGSTVTNSLVCYGSSTTLNGTGASTYTWTGGVTNSIAFTPTLTATYTVIGTAATTCTNSAVRTVTVNTIISATPTQTNVSCFGSNTGVASVSPVSGGTGPYTYSWTPSGGSGATATGLAAGNYTCTITDNILCSITKTITITQPTAAITATATQTNVSCFGSNNGIAMVTLSGGTPAYTYTWSPSGGNAATATGLSAGNYTCSITDANACTYNKIVTVSQPTTAISSTVIVNNPSCFGVCNGSATVTPSGGTGAYTYSWTSAGGTSATAINLCAGGYTCTITDANSCSSNQTVILTNPLVLTANSTASSILCNGGVATVTISAAGGTPAYTGTGTFTASVGSQTYTVTDAHSCTSTTTVSITEPTILVASSTASSILCNGDVSTVTVSATGGTGAYTGTGTFTTTAGPRTYTVTDANSCASTTTVNISQPTVLAASSTASSILCNGDVATVTVSATGGTGSYTGMGTFTATAGSYTYNVTDANSCSATTSITVTEPSTVTVTLTGSPILCNGGIATATVTATGGTAPYTGTGTYTVAAGSFSVTVSDNNGCSITKVKTVNEPAILTASSAASIILCNGGVTSVVVSAAGGTSAYTGVGTFTATAGTQTYTVTDANSCVATTSITVNEPAAITSAQSPTLCSGQSITVGANTYTANGTYTDVLTAINGCDSTVTTNLTIKPTVTFTQSPVVCNGQSITVGINTYTANGIYTDVLTAVNGCDSTVTTNLTVKPTVTFTQSPIVCNGQTFMVGTNTYTTSGTYTDVFTAANGCDSTVTTNLTVRNVITYTQSPQVCNGQSVTVGANTYTATGTYTDLLTTTSGCDSTVTTNLTVSSIITNTQNVSVCNGGSITVGANTYTATGTYTDMLIAAAGCDSIVTTNLTVRNLITYTQSPTICNGQSLTVGINTYTASGTYTDLLTSSAGCDSTVTTNLTVSNSISSSQTLSICSGQSVTVGASTYTASGVFTNTLTTMAGCDSVVTTNLTVNPLPTVSFTSLLDSVCINITYTLSGGNPAGGTYSGTGVSGTNFSVTATGTYTITYTYTDANSCGATATHTVATKNCTPSGIAQVIGNGINFTVYPNPANEFFFIQTDVIPENSIIEIYDMIGRKVSSEKMNDKLNRISLQNFTNGVYHVRIVSNNTILFEQKVIRAE